MRTNLFYLGDNCKSKINKQKLDSKFLEIFAEEKKIKTNWIYIVESEVVEQEKRNNIFLALKDLLSLKSDDTVQNEFLLKNSAFGSLYVLPRRGTKSPWASKALDILKNCNFKYITNIERGMVYNFNHTQLFSFKKQSSFEQKIQVKDKLSMLDFDFVNFFDRMTEEIFIHKLPENYFSEKTPTSMKYFDVTNKAGLNNLKRANKNLGLALSEAELKMVFDYFNIINKNPTDAELMMFAQVNSEHCRHKIFNSKFVIDDKIQEETLFEMIKFTHKKTPTKTILAYTDNAAIIEGAKVDSLDYFPPVSSCYRVSPQILHTVFKAETHNHPTAVCPFPGAATGVGGEIRDEAATGIGGKSKAGFSGFSVSMLDFTNHTHEPSRQSSPLEIMIRAPLGSADFNNEFGRPQLFGYFREFEFHDDNTHWGYHKPIMLAGGVGVISNLNTRKKNLTPGDLLVLVGGPGMKIGIGGGSASSMNAGDNKEILDFNSVQRGNPEIQKRAQEVINACACMGNNNPILSIHDVGAGGLANAVPEILHSAGVGGEVNFDEITSTDTSMSPAEVWCNESQERYVLCISDKNLNLFQDICKREKCPFSVIASVTEEKKLIVSTAKTQSNFILKPVDISLGFLLDSAVRNKIVITSNNKYSEDYLDYEDMILDDCIDKVLSNPTVGSKSFLITIADRSVGGLTARDQMVGPFQTPVADNAVVLWDFKNYGGQVFSLGERSPIAIKNPAAASRMALGETITNLLSAYIIDFKDIKLCANWMAACGERDQDYALFIAVKALAKELCPELELSIPVGKDSLSMKTAWNEKGNLKSVISPVSLNLSAVAKTIDARKYWVPVLDETIKETVLIYIDLSNGNKRLGGSIFSLLHKKFGGESPDLDSVEIIKNFFSAIQELHELDQDVGNSLHGNKSNKKAVFAYHDISDGGLIATLCEMAFAARIGITINIDLLTIDPNAQDWGAFNIRPNQVHQKRDELTFKALFNEELGVVIQTSKSKRQILFNIFRKYNLGKFVFEIGSLNNRDTVEIYRDAKCIYKKPRALLQKIWSDTSLKISSLRDNSDCVKEDESFIDNNKSLENTIHVPQDLHDLMIVGSNLKSRKQLHTSGIRTSKPRIAILREQGVNGHVEMAAAFIAAGFEAWDVHMTDLISKKIKLSQFAGLAISGGFSYGDVLGAGKGWAQSILLNSFLKEEFFSFFNDKNKFIFGVCNGCQFLTELQSILPENEIWPKFKENRSERFESRQSFVEVVDSESLFFKGMSGLKIPIIVSHGQGRTTFPDDLSNNKIVKPIMRYLNHDGCPTESYPENPNGSIGGLTGFTSGDGRIAALMPHPERCFRNIQFSWSPDKWSAYGDYSPWMQIFKNAFYWVNN